MKFDAPLKMTPNFHAQGDPFTFSLCPEAWYLSSAHRKRGDVIEDNKEPGFILPTCLII